VFSDTAMRERVSDVLGRNDPGTKTLIKKRVPPDKCEWRELALKIGPVSFRVKSMQPLTDIAKYFPGLLVGPCILFLDLSSFSPHQQGGFT